MQQDCLAVRGYLWPTALGIIGILIQPLGILPSGGNRTNGQWLSWQELELVQRQRAVTIQIEAVKVESSLQLKQVDLTKHKFIVR